MHNSGTIRGIELLAPARDCATGMIAVDAGADAVYIGGPAFGARVAAGNETKDIAALVEYSHMFGVRVYAALNTIVYENELKMDNIIYMFNMPKRSPANSSLPESTH